MAGYIHSGSKQGKVEDVLTWHDFDGVRVWIHSKPSGSARDVVSVEVQVTGKPLIQPSKEEQAARLRVCAYRQIPTAASVFTSTTLRNLPSGRLFVEHSNIVSRLITPSSNKKTKNVELVESFTGKSIDLSMPFYFDSSDEILKEDGKSKDAIIIAKIYEMLQSSGPRQLSARTAELIGVDVSTVHTAVQVARRNGWLTSNGPGKPGGQLTKSGVEALKKAKGEERIARILGMRGDK